MNLFERIWRRSGLLFHRALRAAIIGYALISVLLVTMILGAVVCDMVVGLQRRDSSWGDLAKIPYYADKPWTAQLIRDERSASLANARYAPFTVWKRPSYTSPTVTIDEAGRRVVPAASHDPEALKVFFFGGSTMWGSSSPDGETIPNQVVELSRGLSGRPLRGVNYGESAWVSTQSVIALQQALQHGEMPDIVIFYEGVNDILMALTNGSAYEHADYGRIAALFNDSDRGRGRAFRTPSLRALARVLMPNTFFQLDRRRAQGSAWSDDDLRRLAADVFRVYRSNLETVRALARHHGFEARFYWQPSLRYDRKPVTVAEAAIEGVDEEWAGLHRRFNAFFVPLLDELKGNDFMNLSGIFENQTQQIYTSPMHLTPEGNRLIAMAILQDLSRNSAAFRGTESCLEF
jgi:lysophospholipase L1-like esterase